MTNTNTVDTVLVPATTRAFRAFGRWTGVKSLRSATMLYTVTTAADYATQAEALEAADALPRPTRSALEGHRA